MKAELTKLELEIRLHSERLAELLDEYKGGKWCCSIHPLSRDKWPVKFLLDEENGQGNPVTAADRKEVLLSELSTVLMAEHPGTEWEVTDRGNFIVISNIGQWLQKLAPGE